MNEYSEAIKKLVEVRKFSQGYLDQVNKDRDDRQKETDGFDSTISQLKAIRHSNQVIALPNNLDEVVEDIKKVEAKYNLRPRQLESIIHYHQMENELLRILG